MGEGRASRTQEDGAETRSARPGETKRRKGSVRWRGKLCGEDEGDGRLSSREAGGRTKIREKRGRRGRVDSLNKKERPEREVPLTGAPAPDLGPREKKVANLPSGRNGLTYALGKKGEKYRQKKGDY